MDKQLKLCIAKRYIDNGESFRPLSILQELVEEGEGDDDVFYWMGRAHEDCRDLMSAFEWYEKCSEGYEPAAIWVANLKTSLGYK